MKIWENIFGFDREETIGERLFFRVYELFVIYFSIKYAWFWVDEMQVNQTVKFPLGIAHYVNLTFMYSNIAYWAFGAFVLALSFGFFRVQKYMYLVAMILFHVFYAARYSQGEISHGSNLAGVSILAFALAYIMYNKRIHIYRAAIGYCMFFFGLAYASAGVCKLIGTGPLWVDGNHLIIWIGEKMIDTYSRDGSVQLNWLQLMIQDHRWLGTMILSFGLLSELSGIGMWFRKIRKFIFFIMLSLHIGIYITMDIYFGTSIKFMIMLLIPWEWVFNKILNSKDRLESGVGGFLNKYA